MGPPAQRLLQCCSQGDKWNGVSCQGSNGTAHFQAPWLLEGSFPMAAGLRAFIASWLSVGGLTPLPRGSLQSATPSLAANFFQGAGGNKPQTELRSHCFPSSSPSMASPCTVRKTRARPKPKTHWLLPTMDLYRAPSHSCSPTVPGAASSSQDTGGVRVLVLCCSYSFHQVHPVPDQCAWLLVTPMSTQLSPP